MSWGKCCTVEMNEIYFTQRAIEIAQEGGVLILGAMGWTLLNTKWKCYYLFLIQTAARQGHNSCLTYSFSCSAHVKFPNFLGHILTSTARPVWHTIQRSKVMHQLEYLKNKWGCGTCPGSETYYEKEKLHVNLYSNICIFALNSILYKNQNSKSNFIKKVKKKSMQTTHE